MANALTLIVAAAFAHHGVADPAFEPVPLGGTPAAMRIATQAFAGRAPASALVFPLFSSALQHLFADLDWHLFRLLQHEIAERRHARRNTACGLFLEKHRI